MISSLRSKIRLKKQPGVEAGKTAATELLQLQNKVRTKLSKTPQTAGDIAAAVTADAEAVYHVLEHLSANDPAVKSEAGSKIADDKFFLT